VYLGLFGNEYGREDAGGVSAVEREFDVATKRGIPRLMYFRGVWDRSRPMKMRQYIERMGTGTGDMIRRCVEADLPEPQFGYRDGFVLSIVRPRLREFDSSGKSSVRMRQKIRRMIGNDAEITTDKMASRLGVTQRTVEKQVRMLCEERVLGRVGPAKGGHWELLE